VLARGAFSDPQVIQMSRSFVCVKVDVTKDSDTAIAMGVEAIPTVTFTTPQGDPLHDDPLVGAVQPHVLVAAMRAASKESSLLSAEASTPTH
jgi:thiol:disulfide interchange protein